MAFKSRAGRSSGVCRDCSELKDNSGSCNCTGLNNSFNCKSCNQNVSGDENSAEYPGYCKNCVDFYDSDSDGDDH